MITPFYHVGKSLWIFLFKCPASFYNRPIENFKAQPADNNPYYIFFVSGLTWEGHDFLDKIRDDGTWKKTVKTIAEKGLDMSMKTIGTIATAFITAATEGAVSAIMKNGGQS